jgi:hypothetical protein
MECSSSLAPDWKNLTIIGSVLSVVVVVLCLWMSMDAEAFIAMKQLTYWSWIATFDCYIDVQTEECSLV